MSAAAMANWAAGNRGVGPGVNKRVFRIMVLSSSMDPELGPGSTPIRIINNHIIHNNVIYVIDDSVENPSSEEFAASILALDL
jgi:hypothetical protein